MAAWVIGTSIKNNYEFQLWVLQPVTPAGIIAIDLLVDILQSSDGSMLSHDALHRRSLYALTAAARGNVDVQQRIMHRGFVTSDSQPFVDTLMRNINVLQSHFYLQKSQVTSNADSEPDAYPHQLLKLWLFISDLIEERRFLIRDLVQEHSIPEESLSDILQLKMLGQEFCTKEWISFMLSSAELATQFYRADTSRLNRCETSLESLPAGTNSDQQSSLTTITNTAFTATLRILDTILAGIIGIVEQSDETEAISYVNHLQISFRSTIAELSSLRRDAGFICSASPDRLYEPLKRLQILLETSATK